jgi:serine protease Do
LLDETGLVLTSHYPLASAKKLEIHLEDGRMFPAEKLGSDLSRDIILLRVLHSGEKFPFLSFTPSSSLTQGQFVAVLGKSQSARSTSISIGILSGKERGDGEDLQIDCRVNMGNTGGPLINLNGDVLGIVSRVAPVPVFPSGMNSGVAFAIPGEVILKILPELKAGKNLYSSPPPSLGVLLERSSLLKGKGLEVKDVIEGTPAFRAGIQKGDFLLTFQGEDIYTYYQFLLMLKSIKKSTKINIEILRQGRKITVSVHIPVLPTILVLPSHQDSKGK